MTNKLSNTKRRADRATPYVVSFLLLSLVFSVFYFTGWLTLAPPVNTETSRPKISSCIFDAIKMCEKEDGKIVKICGIIVQDEAQCCDYYLRDESGEILIEDDSHGLLLPGRNGKKATVYGKLKKRGLTYVLTGKIVFD